MMCGWKGNTERVGIVFRSRIRASVRLRAGAILSRIACPATQGGSCAVRWCQFGVRVY